MECSICHRGHDSQRLPFLCVVDARNRLYEGRIKSLQLLVQNEDLQSQVTQPLADPTAKPSRDVSDSQLTQQRMTEDRTNKILATADKLRDEIKAARAVIQAKKEALARRKSQLSSLPQGLVEGRARPQKDVEKSTQITTYKWIQSADDMARTRSFLCAEAAKLYGLKRVKKNNSNRYEYYLGKLPVVDLTDMNSLSPEVISTSLAHVSHILMLASHYLAIRLPAELTPPHRDYPRPTIFNLATSYHHGEVLFPGTSASINAASEPRLSDPQRVPRPRPLFIDKPLPQLSKEDPSTYSFFLEGVTLLSYDIAWLCCSQGLFAGDKGSFEDICNMGRNLYNLLITQQIQTANHTSPNLINKPSPKDAPLDDATTPGIGPYSHGTTRNYLGGAEGTEYVRSFKLPSPMKLADKLKKKLMGDAPAPDWEVLDDDAWKIEDATENADPKSQTKSETVANVGDKGSPRSGSHGWTKVKSR